MEVKKDPVENHMKRLGLTEEGLGEETWKSMKLFCKCVSLLGVRDVRISSFYVAWTSLLMRKAELERELEVSQAFNAYWKAKVRTAEKYLDDLKRTREELAHNLNEEVLQSKKQLQEISMFTMKSRDYMQSVSRSQGKLSEVRYEDRLNHSNILKLKVEHDRLKEDLGQMTLEVESYANIPPDLPMARLEVARLEKELEMLKLKLVESSL